MDGGCPSGEDRKRQSLKEKKEPGHSRSCKWFSPAGTWGHREESDAMRLENKRARPAAIPPSAGPVSCRAAHGVPGESWLSADSAVAGLGQPGVLQFYQGDADTAGPWATLSGARVWVRGEH